MVIWIPKCPTKTGKILEMELIDYAGDHEKADCPQNIQCD